MRTFLKVTVWIITTWASIAPAHGQGNALRIDMEAYESLHFGTVIAPASGGTVTIHPDGRRTLFRVVAPYVPGDYTSAASFRIYSSNENSNNEKYFSITLPQEYILQNEQGNTISLTNFVSSLHDNKGSLRRGELYFTVGATLNVGANQSAGTYTSRDGGFTVVMNYE